mmetsp:Transcript_11501/g.30994  ORF Transcript_11501/g.30994 Transcript_11501/m.30994 type:complete len:316 (-) Transcript_11501:1001-1948(-)|eukprot:CAMPEP_0185833426 /NCGR_PEP_ID=MMETSP1353-20130828/2794_1 /TAXON_ID=1077150 /ORGANISM="Erythrolobus australicus, Strain CCMP3124" /LENGTH=315 /DNA_ID=CAMNT_0028531715 /DNA_START=161 /DNA_END=1108 /DNA_ORIENTATION=+
MEDLEGYLTNASVCIQGKKKTLDSVYESVIESNEKLAGKEGETTGIFSIHAGFAGKSAAQIAKANLRSNFKNCEKADSTESKEVAAALKKAILDTQQDIYAQWRKSITRHGSHSTIVLLRDGYVFCANMGDGGAIICRAEGDIGLLSEKSKRLDEIEAPDVKVYGLDWEDEFILMGCNSFWKTMSTQQAVSVARSALQKFRDVNHVAQRLAYAAQINGATGNITVSIILLNASCAYGSEVSNEIEDPESPRKTGSSIAALLSPRVSQISRADMLSDTSSNCSSNASGSSRLFRSRNKPKPPRVFLPRSAAGQSDV